MQSVAWPVWLRLLVTVIVLLIVAVVLDRWGYYFGAVLPAIWVGALIWFGLLGWAWSGPRG